MTDTPPENIKPDDQIEILWQTDEDETQLVIGLGGAKVTVWTDNKVEGSEDALELLVNNLPYIFDQAMTALDKQSEEDE